MSLSKRSGFKALNAFNLILTHWGRVTHICVSKLTIIGSYIGLSPDRRQAIIWTHAGLLLIGPLGTNLSGILIEIQTFSVKKMRLKVSSAKLRPFFIGLNELNTDPGWLCVTWVVALYRAEAGGLRIPTYPQELSLINFNWTNSEFGTSLLCKPRMQRLFPIVTNKGLAYRLFKV